MRIGYNTNGFAHHELLDAIDLLAELGYQSVAITLDHHALNPYATDCRQRIDQVRDKLRRYGLSSVVETGARFLLDRWFKHEPTLITENAVARTKRIDFLCRAIDVATDLRSDCVSLWSGVLRDPVPREVAWERLVESLRPVIEHARQRRVLLGFEPEPGMFVDTMNQFQELIDRVSSSQLRLTLDIGHLHCLGETPIADAIRRWSQWLTNVHLEDMRAGVHEHLMFGEGEIDFPPVFEALREVGYQEGVHVELSRHSHEAPTAARRSWEFLSTVFQQSH